MARIAVKPDDEILRQLERVGDTKRILKKMLRAAAPPLVSAMKKRLEAHRHSGALIDAIGHGTPKRAKRSKKLYIMIGPIEGYDPETRVPHMRKMMSLEYGTSHQNATPFLDAAARDAQEKSINAMRESYNREVTK